MTIHLRTEDGYRAVDVVGKFIRSTSLVLWYYEDPVTPMMLSIESYPPANRYVPTATTVGAGEKIQLRLLSDRELAEKLQEILDEDYS